MAVFECMIGVFTLGKHLVYSSLTSYFTPYQASLSMFDEKSFVT
jgi:hypothetical protein